VSIESCAGLEYIGFNTDTATEIWNRWDGRPDGEFNPDSLWDYISAHIARLHYVFGHLAPLDTPPTKSPAEAMTDLGIRQDVQDGILHPDYTEIFETQPLHFWLTDTLRINYFHILEVLGRSQTVATDIKGTGAISQESRESYFKYCTVVDTPSPLLDGHTALYNGKAAPEIKATLTPLVDKNGNIDLYCLRSSDPGDFSPRREAQYWRLEKETAENFLEYARRRNPRAEMLLIRMQVPDNFLEPFKTEDLYWGADWREYVWRCRHGERLAKFRHLWNDADLIKGHILRLAYKRVDEIKEGNIQTDILYEHVMAIPHTGRKSTQWAFMKEDIVDRLAEAIEGKMHITVKPGLDTLDTPEGAKK